MTNPDMLHCGILPNHSQWRPFLRKLQYIVVDEAHHYRGAFGSHFAMVLRRLLRVCKRIYGSTPQIIAASATIGNPAEHVEALTSQKVGRRTDPFPLAENVLLPASERGLGRFAC
jgi:DEAD/DEAH box helicase domain-containing protein